MFTCYLFISKKRLSSCKLKCMNTHFRFKGFYVFLSVVHNKQHFEEMKISGMQDEVVHF